MKKVNTKGLQLGTKRTYSMASGLSYSIQNRPFKKLSNLSERMTQKRF